MCFTTVSSLTLTGLTPGIPGGPVPGIICGGGAPGGRPGIGCGGMPGTIGLCICIIIPGIIPGIGTLPGIIPTIQRGDINTQHHQRESIFDIEIVHEIIYSSLIPKRKESRFSIIHILKLNKVHTSYSSTIAHFNYLGTTDLLKDLRTNSKPEYNIKSLNYIQQNLKVFKPRFGSIELCLLLFSHDQWFKSY